MSDLINDEEVIEEVCVACKNDDHEHCLCRNVYQPKDKDEEAILRAVYGDVVLTICCCSLEVGQ